MLAFHTWSPGIHDQRWRASPPICAAMSSQVSVEVAIGDWRFWLGARANVQALIGRVARPRPGRAARRHPEKVPPGTLRLLTALPMPAFVQDRYLNVLAANPMARALSPNMRPGVNRLLAAFLDPAEKDLHEDWEQSTAAVGQLRAAMGAESDDPRMAALVGELSMKSDQFRRLWARQDVVRRAGGPARLRHPEVGDLELHREKLIVAGTGGQVLVIYHPDPGTASAGALALLGAITASSGIPPADVPASPRTPHQRPQAT